jgi:hypothetical protein
VHPSPVPRVAPDPDDDVVIGTALAVKAILIVTGTSELFARNCTGREPSNHPLSPYAFGFFPLRCARSSTVGKLTGSVCGKSRL